MNNIRAIDMLLIDEIFDMGGGYVLNFSDRTFAQFFAEELNIDIDAPTYARNGTSKAKRFRCLLQTVDKPTVIRILNTLWEYREAIRQRAGAVDKVENSHGRFLALINRLQGNATGPVSPNPVNSPVPAFDRPTLFQLKNDLLALSTLPPQAAGYAFEKWLTRFFNAYGLAAHEPFKLRGEQIDGSFQFGHETYLVEAKWQGKPTGVGELHTFHGKIEQKAAWTRGLFVSNCGFTEDGLAAFGRGKRMICMDGLDLFDALDREIPLNQVLERKVRRAAETGLAFIRVRDLFPR